MTYPTVESSYRAEERLRAVLKAVVGGWRPDPLAGALASESDSAFAEAGALALPYDPYALCLLFERSNLLRQNVDAYAANIDGFGRWPEPTIDLRVDGPLSTASLFKRFKAQKRG